MSSVFDAAIRMEQQTRIRLTACEGLPQRCSGKVCSQTRPQAPTDNAARVQVQHYRQEHVLLAKLDIRDVTAPLLVFRSRSRCLKSIIWQGFQIIPELPQSAVHTSRAGLHAPLPHNFRDPILSDHQAFSAQRLVNARTTITAFTVVVDLPDLQQQVCLVSGSLAELPVGPGIVSRSRHLQMSAQRFYTVVSSVFPDEPERFRRS